MKILLAGLLVLLAATGLYAITVEEIGRLSELKTNDDLMLQMTSICVSVALRSE
jgi:hypothetical protein